MGMQNWAFSLDACDQKQCRATRAFRFSRPGDVQRSCHAPSVLRRPPSLLWVLLAAPAAWQLCGTFCGYPSPLRSATAAARTPGVAAKAGGAREKLLSKLREKSSRPRPKLNTNEVSALTSSAIPPGYKAPDLCSRVHKVLEENPGILEGVSSSTQLRYELMSVADAQDLADLQAEWFPEESYPDGLPWCEKLLADPGVMALKAILPGGQCDAAVGVVIALASKSAIQEYTDKGTVDLLRRELTKPRCIPWDTPERRELAYIQSVGVIGELRRRGVAKELLQRSLVELREKSPDLRAVALDLASYNQAAMRCYEALGFEKWLERQEAYNGDGRRTHSALFYVMLLDGEPGE